VGDRNGSGPASPLDLLGHGTAGSSRKISNRARHHTQGERFRANFQTRSPGNIGPNLKIVCQECAGAQKPFNRTRVRVSFGEWSCAPPISSYPIGMPLSSASLPGSLPGRGTVSRAHAWMCWFDSSPAGCPPESVIGNVVVHTQVLPVRLEGRVYFVSYGGAAFPDVVMVVRGDGVTVDLVGDTLIKNGVTSTTFKAGPDRPFSSFELMLPEGPYSALAANGNLCTVKGGLKMPTEFVGQNGAVIHQSTPISVSGCPKAHKAKKKPKKKSKKHSKSKKPSHKK
jgi:hypothetical protein